MINEEKVILMTKLAAYETREGKKNSAIVSFFRSDYIGWQVLKTVICATIAFFVVLGMVGLYNFESFMVDIYKTDLLELGRNLLIRYLEFVGVFCVLTYVIYTYRYSKARRSLRHYYNNLRKLAAMNRKSHTED